MLTESLRASRTQWLLVAVHPFAGRDEATAKDFDANPAAQRLRGVRVRHWDWLAKYYEAASEFYSKKKDLAEVAAFYRRASINHSQLVLTTR